MAELLEYLQQAVEDGASDLFLIAGGCVSEKVEGRICAISEEKVLPPETERLITGIYEMAGRDMGRYQTTGDDDFSFAVPGLAGSGSMLIGKEARWPRWCGWSPSPFRTGKACTFRRTSWTWRIRPTGWF